MGKDKFNGYEKRDICICRYFFYYEEIEQPPSIRYIYLFQRLDYNQTCLKGVEVVDSIRNLNRCREFSIPNQPGASLLVSRVKWYHFLSCQTLKGGFTWSTFVATNDFSNTCLPPSHCILYHCYFMFSIFFSYAMRRRWVRYAIRVANASGLQYTGKEKL